MTVCTQKADILLKSNCIYTMKEEPFQGAVAVADNQIIAVGRNLLLTELMGPQTKVYDFGDCLLIPGFIEGHSHAGLAAIFYSGANLLTATSREECVALAAKWAKENPESPWVFGGGWFTANWKNKNLPGREELDAVLPDRPVFLLDHDGHNGWFNSRALAELGVDRHTPDLGGTIYKDADTGEPTGYIQDAQTFHAIEKIMSFLGTKPELFLSGILESNRRLGITAVNEMTASRPDDDLVTALKCMEQEEKLTTRYFITLGLFENNVDEILAGINQAGSDFLKITSGKIFLDGVGAAHSAAMLEPYADQPDCAGSLIHQPEVFVKKVLEADQAGIIIRTHGCGNRAVRLIIDAYETAIKKNGERNRRHSIEHCDTIHPDDIKRLAQLPVVCNLTPDFLAPTDQWQDNPYMKIYDESVKTQLWNTGSILASGAVVTFGSDAPFSALNPMVQIYRAVTRVSNDGQPQGGFLPQQKITVQEALQCYTQHSAYAAGMEEKLGTLETGKYADIVVIDRNILTCPNDEILTAKVVFTMLGGKVIYKINYN